MIAEFTKEQRKQIRTGDRRVAARRLHELLQNRNGLENPPSIDMCEEMVDLVVAGIEQLDGSAAKASTASTYRTKIGYP
jgi:hypothetical protein